MLVVQSNHRQSYENIVLELETALNIRADIVIL